MLKHIKELKKFFFNIYIATEIFFIFFTFCLSIYVYNLWLSFLFYWFFLVVYFFQKNCIIIFQKASLVIWKIEKALSIAFLSSTPHFLIHAKPLHSQKPIFLRGHNFPARCFFRNFSTESPFLHFYSGDCSILIPNDFCFSGTTLFPGFNFNISYLLLKSNIFYEKYVYHQNNFILAIPVTFLLRNYSFQLNKSYLSITRLEMGFASHLLCITRAIL